MHRTIPGLSFILIRFIVLVFLLVLLAPFSTQASTNISVGPAGLESIRHDGVEYLRRADCTVTGISLRNSAGGLLTPGVGPARSQVSNDSTTRTYGWGALKCHYSVSGDCVKIDVYVGTSQYDIQRLVLKVVTLAMPMPSNGGIPHVTSTKGNLEGPDILSLSSDGTTVLIANEEVAKPSDLRGQRAPGGVSIVLDTNLHGLLPPLRVAGPESPRRDVELTRPILAGHTDHYSLALCFLREGESPRRVLGDFFERIAARFPATLNWPDRRPIASLFLAGTGRKNPLNPRDWRIIKPSVEVTSPAGRTEFQRRLLEEADKTVAILKQMDAQGVIVWDIEGEPYPQPVDYVGDPHQLAPEMQGAVDKFFKRFTDAGLRCGMTLRPQRFVLSNGQGFQENSDDPNSIFNTLDEKIQYARNRWGCSLFYIDSNGTWGWPMEVSIFRRLNRKHPDILLIPEGSTILYYASTSPYWDSKNGSSPSEQARWVYPGAFGVIFMRNVPMERDVTWKNLVECVKGGDVLMFPGWFNGPRNKAVLQIYQEALGPNWRKARWKNLMIERYEINQKLR